MDMFFLNLWGKKGSIWECMTQLHVWSHSAPHQQKKYRLFLNKRKFVEAKIPPRPPDTSNYQNITYTMHSASRKLYIFFILSFF